MQSLLDKIAVITGGGSGIGRASAHSLAGRGARVVVADIDEQRVDSVVTEITATGAHAAGRRCDVGADTAFEDLKAFTLDRFGGVDVVMNNVGVLTHGRPDYLPVEEWQRRVPVTESARF